ncbi:MAG TPA: flagellar biosynthetic protein FliQ [Terriglobales bacterium]|nr:flagellar biosynthetic protein FliQ [Terriglobales bacterium]
MGTDQAVELMRGMLRETLIVSAPLLLATCITSFVLSFVQTLTSLQEQTLTTVPRLLIVFAIAVVALPWFAQRLVTYTVVLFTNFHQYLG